MRPPAPSIDLPLNASPAQIAAAPELALEALVREEKKLRRIASQTSLRADSVLAALELRSSKPPQAEVATTPCLVVSEDTVRDVSVEEDIPSTLPEGTGKEPKKQ